MRSAESNALRLASDEGARRLSRLKEELALLDIPEQLSRGICHCDANPSNSLYSGEKISAVLDFDMSSYLCFICDIANVIYWWAYPRSGEPWLPRARAILQAYQAVRPMTALEKLHLYDLVKMAFLTSLGWFVHIDSEYCSGLEAIDYLNSIGREKCGKLLFDS